MQFNELRTATLRSVFAGVYVANLIISSMFFGKHYLDILASLFIIVCALSMLTITLQQPEQLMVYFESTGKEFVFTWRMRMLADIIQILFLISKGMLGEIMAIVTGVFLFVAFSLAQKRPDIFRELFRKHAGDPMVEGEAEEGYRETAAAAFSTLGAKV
mmetsp:Transcript_25772/g.43997  ORF Transcript_25772/g.43997 Transcript_25772/m.43997 type:complete len:159 (-) Transcript_25772:193-669(-)